MANLEEEKVKFMKIYANLPEKIRKEDIIIVIDKQPYTWNAAYFEISSSTKLGESILKELKGLNII